MKFYFSAKAELDVDQAFSFLKKEAGKKVAEDFIRHIEVMTDNLVANPEMGSNRYSHIFDTLKVKAYMLSDFNYIAFYEYSEQEVKIIRVLHSKRDIDGILS